MNGHRMDQETAERLLVGPVADAQDGPEALVRFLAAVRAAPRPHELDGEGAALQAFRLARAGGPVAVSRPERRLRAGLLGAKLALAGLLATATGGVALAAVTGNLPGPLPGGDGAASSATPSTRPDGRPTPATAPTTPAVGPSDHPASPSALAGLCTAYRAEGDDRRRVLETPRYADLVAAAGGRQQVAGYCDDLLDDKDKPSGPGAGPTRRPSSAPSDRVTGRPEQTPAKPSAETAPTSRPAGPSVRQPASVGASPR
ncbi:hypothetical protein AB0F68_05540 [Micromonospora sp. NPDC023966]|uniref:hypothetical protein n=1 Tax=Micromonospora sp. NPDC023966 TaxID=3154699 RepID=UPI0033E33930